ncbi:MAG: hypothetical protein QF886_00360, partial [Planctomycetota bacterium]|nr:hypothetical protein [Planctomycetota bacterium]
LARPKSVSDRRAVYRACEHTFGLPRTQWERQVGNRMIELIGNRPKRLFPQEVMIPCPKCTAASAGLAD